MIATDGLTVAQSWAVILGSVVVVAGALAAFLRRTLNRAIDERIKPVIGDALAQHMVAETADRARLDKRRRKDLRELGAKIDGMAERLGDLDGRDLEPVGRRRR